ncbi:hypothetical protein EK21DRAFT_93242 [Setomelanomma holmii]|uniref:Uncharacterized protein n=1 Tax=Setomelanomma holmii TaxID=210430 RepID=A0A9P4LGA7_9PLEO|nr:hypothetical protein EK21DRAFT_93242 [Setomelanomma holmii]
MATNDTLPVTAPTAKSPWSNEAVFALVTLFIMIITSSIGFICKYRRGVMLNTSFMVRSSALDLDKIGLPSHRDSVYTHGWVDMADARRYQQETYIASSYATRSSTDAEYTTPMLNIDPMYDARTHEAVRVLKGHMHCSRKR